MRAFALSFVIGGRKSSRESRASHAILRVKKQRDERARGVSRVVSSLAPSSRVQQAANTMSPLGEEKSDNDEGVDSSDEALCEILGLTSLDGVTADDVVTDDHAKGANLNEWGIPNSPLDLSDDITSELQHLYKKESMCMLPNSLSLSAAAMRRLTDELVWGQSVQVDKTYETIRVMLKNGQIQERRTLTRLENFVDHHEGWKTLVHGYLRECITAVCGTEMVLYKEKLNLKPPGGSGFAPHLDTPSLRVALGDSGPQTFVTVMVAIDNMTPENGCLRMFKGEWTETNHCELIPPSDDNPDAGGREGAVPLDVADSLDFEDITCQGGDIVAFNGWTPHRSAANASAFPRRAVFLTYNPATEGDFHQRYYERMEELRNEWRHRVGLGGQRQLTQDEQFELDALATVPK